MRKVCIDPKDRLPFRDYYSDDLVTKINAVKKQPFLREFYISHQECKIFYGTQKIVKNPPVLSLGPFRCLDAMYWNSQASHLVAKGEWVYLPIDYKDGKLTMYRVRANPDRVKKQELFQVTDQLTSFTLPPSSLSALLFTASERGIKGYDLNVGEYVGHSLFNTKTIQSLSSHSRFLFGSTGEQTFVLSQNLERLYSVPGKLLDANEKYFTVNTNSSIMVYDIRKPSKNYFTCTSLKKHPVLSAKWMKHDTLLILDSEGFYRSRMCINQEVGTLHDTKSKILVKNLPSTSSLVTNRSHTLVCIGQRFWKMAADLSSCRSGDLEDIEEVEVSYKSFLKSKTKSLNPRTIFARDEGETLCFLGCDKKKDAVLSMFSYDKQVETKKTRSLYPFERMIK
jgi:hypothetical protein